MRDSEAVGDGPTRGSSGVKRATIGVVQAMLAVSLVRGGRRGRTVVARNWHAERAHSWAWQALLRGSVGGRGGELRLAASLEVVRHERRCSQ
jgi:hypothetical protein